MKVTFDSKSDVMRIKFQEGKYEVSTEIDEGIIIDKTKDNNTNTHPFYQLLYKVVY